MKKKPNLKQKIKQTRVLNCLLSIVCSISTLSTIILLSLAVVFKQGFSKLFISGCVCAVVMILVNNFQTIVTHEENSLHFKQFEEDYNKEK